MKAYYDIHTNQINLPDAYQLYFIKKFKTTRNLEDMFGMVYIYIYVTLFFKGQIPTELLLGCGVTIKIIGIPEL